MRITLAKPWTDASGVTHQANETVDAPGADARALLYQGFARTADEPAPEPPQAEPTPEPEETPAPSTPDSTPEEEQQA